jgi:uncharacterized protein (DUF1697 family)
MSSTFIALLRGINVGRAKRISMSDLRELVESVGGSQVRTLLNSGNVVFSSRSRNPAILARKIESALSERHGFSAATVVISAQDLDEIIESNPLISIAQDPSKHLVAFALNAERRDEARDLLETRWTPEAFALGPNAAYLWCSPGILESKLLQAFARATGNTTTTRNWATVTKLQKLASVSPE